MPRNRIAPYIVSAALGALSLEASTARAQDIGAETTLVQGLEELEHYAEAGETETIALRLSPSSASEGRFADLRNDPEIDREFASIAFPSAAISNRIDALYSSFSRHERRSGFINVIFIHTHPTSAIRAFAHEINPALESAVNRGLRLTLPPSTTDILNRSPESIQSRNIIEGLRRTPRSRVRFHTIVVDETLTYFASPLSTAERRRMGFINFALYSPFRLSGQPGFETPSIEEFEEARSRWALFVGEALQQGDTWDTIFHSREYQNLRNFYAEYYNVALTAVPNEGLDTETLARLGYR